MCQFKGAGNGVNSLEHWLSDQMARDDTRGYDWMICSDLAGAADLHADLRHLFEGNLADRAGC